MTVKQSQVGGRVVVVVAIPVMNFGLLVFSGSLPDQSIQQAQSPSDFGTLNLVCHNIQAANTP